MPLLKQVIMGCSLFSISHLSHDTWNIHKPAHTRTNMHAERERDRQEPMGTNKKQYKEQESDTEVERDSLQAQM